MSYQHPQENISQELLKTCPTLPHAFDAAGMLAVELINSLPAKDGSFSRGLVARLLFRQVLDDFYAVQEVALRGRYAPAATIVSSMQEKIWGVFYYASSEELAQKWLTYDGHKKAPEDWGRVMRAVLEHPDVFTDDPERASRQEGGIYTFLCMAKHGNPQAMRGGLGFEELRPHIYYFPVADPITLYVSARSIYLACRYLLNACAFLAYATLMPDLDAVTLWQERVRAAAEVNRQFFGEIARHWESPSEPA